MTLVRARTRTRDQGSGGVTVGIWSHFKLIEIRSGGELARIRRQKVVYYMITG